MIHERLAITLSVTAGGTAHTIPGANVKAVELDRLAYGFSGAVEFVMVDEKAYGGDEEDTFILDFVKPDLIEVALTVTAVFESPETADSIEPVSVTGLGVTRTLTEYPDKLHTDRAILWRRYRIEFVDPARLLWGQHYPCELNTEKSPKDVIDAHKGAKITVTYDWDALATQAPLFFLNLLPEHGASFYDFIAWYVDTNNAVLTYDYATPGYELTAAKDASGTPTSLFGDDVERLSVVFPEVPRFARNVLNSYTESFAKSPVANAQAVEGIHQDYLLRTPIAQDVDDRVTLETSRLFVRSSELQVVFRRWPTITFAPGLLVKFVAANLWGADSIAVQQTWRVFEHTLRVRATEQGPDAEHNFTSTDYDIEIGARLEQKDEKYVRLPAYVAPEYPGYLEGKVVSAVGEDDELTYDFATDSDTSLDTYTVKVPLFEDKTVAAPYDPYHGYGKVYVPLYKNARVLLALELRDARVDRLLDWREGVRMAKDAQGEQIFFGKKIGAATMMNHSYDNAQPVFNIARTNDKDKGTIQIKEGALIIQIKEDS